MTVTHYFFKIPINIILPLLGLSGLFLLGFANAVLYAFRISSMRATYVGQFILSLSS
jgi:hypothetical protein